MKISKEDVSVKNGQMQICLYREENGKDIRDISVFIDKNGDLRIDGYDFGPAVEKITGKDEYEFWTTVKAKGKPLLKERVHFETALPQFGETPIPFCLVSSALFCTVLPGKKTKGPTPSPPAGHFQGSVVPSVDRFYIFF